MRDGKGYLLPDNPQPEGLRCLKIWIPDDPTGYYLSAMSGAFSDMARWTQWEKDGTNRASLAAQTWKDAVDYTYENGWLDCDMDCCEELSDRLTNIESLLQELTNMNINVNCGCGCGCNCGGSQNQPPLNAPYPIPPLPSSDSPETPINGWKCDAANQLYSDWYTLFNELHSQLILGDATVAALIIIAGGLAVITAGLTVLLAVLAAAAGAGAVLSVAWVRDWLEHHKDDIICTIMSSSSPAQAYNNMMAFIEANEDIPLGNAAGFFVRNQLVPVVQNTDWNLIFTPGSMEIASSNVASDCSSCGLSIPPASVEGYEWRRALSLQEVQASPHTTTKVIGATDYTYGATIPTAGTNWDTQIRCVLPTLNAGETIVGFTILINESETSGGINDPATGHVRITGLQAAYEGPAPFRVLVVSTDGGGVHQTALEAAASFDQVSGVSGSTADNERTLVHYSRVGVGETPPGNLSLTVAEIYYAVLLP